MVFIPRWERYRDKKPANPELDESHELAEFIDNCFVFQQDGVIYDLATKSRYNVPSGVTEKPDGIRFNGVSKVTLNKPFEPASGLSFVFDVTRERLQAEGIFSDKNAANWETAGLSLNLRLDGLLLRCGVSRTTVNNSSIAVQVGKRMSIAAVGSVGGLASFYHDLKQPTAYSFRDTLTSFTKSSINARIGTYYSEGDTWSLKGTLHHLYKFHKELSFEELTALYEAPYQILKPRRRWFDIGAAVASGNLLFANAISNALAQDIALQQTHNANIANAFASSFADNIAVSVIAPTDLVFSGSLSSAQASTFSVQQVHDLLSDGATSQSLADAIAVALNNTIVLSFANALSTASASAIGATQTHNLLNDPAFSTSNAETVQLVQSHLFAFADAISSGLADVVVASQLATLTLSLANATSTSTADNLSLTQDHQITLSGATAQAIAEALQLTTQQTLVLDNAQAQAIAQSIVLLGDGLGDILNPNIKIVTKQRSINVIKH